MSTNECGCCGRPTPDGYACAACGIEKPQRHLGEIGDLLPVALDVAYGQTARTQTGGGGGGGEPRLELNLSAKARLDKVGNALTTWTRHIAEERGLREPTAGTYSVYAMSDDPIEFAAQWLDEHCEWMRHRAEVDEFVRDVAECAAVMRGLAAGPRERVYLGPCGAPRLDELTVIDPVTGEPVQRPVEVACDTPLYGRLGASKATCRTCGAEHVPDQRIQERAELAGQYTYTAAEIADAYPALRANTITKWHGRGLLVNHGTEGRPLYDVAEVLQVAETADLQERRKIRQRVALGAGTGA